MFDEAVAKYRAGRLADAETALHRFLKRSPKHFDALHLLGIIAAQTHRGALAIERFRRAIALNPTMPAVHRNLANALMEAGRPREAVESYDAAIRLKPDFWGAYVGRGMALLKIERPQSALDSLDRALAAPGEPSPLALQGRAAALVALDRHAEALEACDRLLALEPASADTHVNRAVALRRLKRPDEALSSCERALELGADPALVLIVQGAALADLGRPADALPCFEALIRQRPDDANAHNSRGSVLLDLQRPEEALECIERALTLQPDFANAYNHRGVALAQLSQFDRALESLERAMALAPQSSDFRMNTAHAHLQCGRFEAGWPLYESRPDPTSAAGAGRSQRPEWLGMESIAGRTLVVHAEQGLGDTIQFCRYLRPLSALGAKVVFQAPARLLRLLSSLHLDAELIPDSAPAAAGDVQCRLMSLPLALSATFKSIPVEVPYLSAEPALVAQWRHRLGTEGFKIGICWQGAQTKMDLGRSVSVTHFRSIADLPGVRLIAIQKGSGLEQLNGQSGAMGIELPLPPIDDGPDAFVDTAAVMECLDLIITTDTAIAHLAGALGRPAWVLLQQVPDWRWLLSRADSPWYPQTRLFRQPRRGDWASVFDAVRGALEIGVLGTPATTIERQTSDALVTRL